MCIDVRGVLAAAWLCVPGCASEPGEPFPAQADVEALSIPDGRYQNGRLLTAGQISEEQIAALAGLGYRSFISLRPAEESGAGWEEGWAERHGVHFERLQIAGQEGVTVDNARRLSELLDEQQGPTVLYCSSSNRVGALLALKAHFLDGHSSEGSLAIGKEAGMTRLTPVVEELLGLPPSPDQRP